MHGQMIYGHSPDHTPNSYEELDFDFEQVWREGTMFVFKGYDSHGQVVFFKLSAHVLMENLLGFAADIEIKEPPPTERTR